MDKSLHNEELSALPEGSAKRARISPAAGLEAVTYDFRRAGMLSAEQIQAIRSLHEAFAKNLSESLGQYLNSTFEITLTSIDQITFADFAQRIADPNYVASIAVHPLETAAAMALDPRLALPIVEMLLGGAGAPVAQVREITEIEEEVLASVVQLICTDLEAAWLPVLKLDFCFQHRQEQSQLYRLMSPKEKILSLSLEVRAAEIQGMLNVALPAAAVRALVRELEGQVPYGSETRGPSGNRHLRDLLERSRFHAELLSPGAGVSAMKLMHLKVGEVLEIPIKVAARTLFKVENQTLFLANPVAIGDRRAAEMFTKAADAPISKEEPN